MTLHAVQKDEKEATKNSNERLFNCSREELNDLLKDSDFGDAVNYRLTVVIPPEREKMKGGIFLPSSASETEQSKTSIGRVIRDRKSVV